MPKLTLPIACAAIALIAGVATAGVFAAPEKNSADQASSTPAAPEDEQSGPKKSKKVEHGLAMHHPYGYHLGPILDRIKANAEQRQKISVIVESFRSTIEPLRDQYRQKQQEFIQSMTSGATDEAIMESQVELAHLQSQISSNYTLMRLQVRRLLTPPQIEQFEAYRREHGWTHAQ